MTICAAVLALTVLVFFCTRWWIFEPQEAANRARAAYNTENHQIDSVGYPVDAHALASVPSGTLQSIPSYGGDDKTLTHPRTISISYSSSSEWCSNIKVDIPPGSALVVAAEDDSLFIHDHYVATYTNRTLTVCLVDGFTKNEASKSVVAKLALQAKPQPATK
jgi:cbb3-type cytochrome oxidase subunit 3